jgi:hypothetical protein
MENGASSNGNENGGEGGVERVRQTPFAVSLYRFQEEIDALRQLHEEVCVHAAELDSDEVTVDQLSAVKALSPERRVKLKSWIESGVSRDDSDLDPEKMAEENEEALSEIFGDNLVAARQAQQMMMRRAVSPRREVLLRSSLLTMIVSAFEVLLGGLAGRHFEIHPKSIGSAKQFTLEELRGFASLDDIQDAAIAHRVYQLLQAPLVEWTKWLDKDSGLGVKLENLAIDYKVLGEIVQRRHVIVHNGGAVSSLYLDRVQFDGDPPALGSSLAVDQAYLEMALDHMDSVGNLMAVGVWAKERPTAEVAAVSALSNRMEQLLFAGRWLALRKICSVGRHIASLEVSRQIFQVNEWLSIKRLEGKTSILKDLTDWDTSALGPQFRLVQFALLDESDLFFATAPQIYGEGGIGKEPLESWPVFEELRRDVRFDRLTRAQDVGALADDPNG